MSKTEWEPLSPSERGGKIQKRYKRIDGFEHACVNCSHQFTISEENIYAQRGRQVNSLTDSDGNAWLVTLVCPSCGYTISSTKWEDKVL